MTTEVTVEASGENQGPMLETTVKAMYEKGLTFGAFFPIDWLENQLQIKRDDDPLKFGFAVASLNWRIIDDGFVLSCRQMEGRGYIVVLPPVAEDFGALYRAQIFRLAKRIIRLYNGLLKNPESKLTEEDKRRLKNKLEKSENDYIVLRRSERFKRLAEEHDPTLLNHYKIRTNKPHPGPADDPPGDDDEPGPAPVPIPK